MQQFASFADTVGKDLRASHIDIANGAEKSCAHWKADVGQKSLKILENRLQNRCLGLFWPEIQP